MTSLYIFNILTCVFWYFITDVCRDSSDTEADDFTEDDAVGNYDEVDIVEYEVAPTTDDDCDDDTDSLCSESSAADSEVITVSSVISTIHVQANHMFKHLTHQFSSTYSLLIFSIYPTILYNPAFPLFYHSNQI